MREVAGFLAIAVGWAWAWWVLTIVLLRTDPASGPAVATMTLGTCAPAIAAWVCWQRREGARAAWRALVRCVVPTGPWRTWAVATVAVVAVIGTASAVQRASGADLPDAP